MAHSFIGAGLDAAISRRVALDRTGTIRNLDYLWAAWPLLEERPWPRLKVEIDGSLVAGQYMQVICASISNYAHYFNLPAGPGFTAFLYRGSGVRDMVRILLRGGIGRNLGQAADVVLPVTKSIRMDSAGGRSYYQCDGEAGVELPLDATIAPGGR